MLSQAAANAEMDSLPVVDNQCHPFGLDNVLESDDEFDVRASYLGTCVGASPQLAGDWETAKSSARVTPMVRQLRGWLARYLDSEGSDLNVARRERLREDVASYVTALLASERISALLADDGFPRPGVPLEAFQRAAGVTVYRKARIETWIDAILEWKPSFDDLVSELDERIERACADPQCVGFKSVIAYRTGLDISPVSSTEAADAYERWQRAGYKESRFDSKVCRDFLTERAFTVAASHDRVFHFHTGMGDPDVSAKHSHPSDLYSFAARHHRTPVVFIHSGWPWIDEAIYSALTLPNVYLDLSALIPWGWARIDSALETIIGAVPWTRILYGSDGWGGPEMIAFASRAGRRAVGRTLMRLVDRDMIAFSDVEAIATAVLGGNTLALHGIQG